MKKPKLPNIRTFFIPRKDLKSELIYAGKLVRKFFRLSVVKTFVIFIIILLLSPFILFFIYKPKMQEDINYGVTFSHKYAGEMGLDWRNLYISMLDDLGVDNIRLIAYWDETEKFRDVYNFEDVVWQVQKAQKRGVNVIMTIGRKVPRYPECFEPQWWKFTSDEKEKERELLEYVKIAVSTMKRFDNIKMWQVENEPLFKFGECVPALDKDTVKKEVELVRSLDSRPIMIQDSGEGGYWYPTYSMADYLGISMYRKVWYDFWNEFIGNFNYFKYPLAHWTYKIKAELTMVPSEKIIVTELQGEPWGPGRNNELSQFDKDQTMSRHMFLDTISYAQKSGFKDLYFWGVEWWYWEKINNNNPFFWDTAKALFN